MRFIVADSKGSEAQHAVQAGANLTVDGGTNA
jgi:hypothetical protein